MKFIVMYIRLFVGCLLTRLTNATQRTARPFSQHYRTFKVLGNPEMYQKVNSTEYNNSHARSGNLLSLGVIMGIAFGIIVAIFGFICDYEFSLSRRSKDNSPYELESISS